MKIRMRTLAAGPSGVMQPGSVHYVSDECGRHLVAGGFADREAGTEDLPAPATGDVGPIEQATQRQPQTAELAVGKRQRKGRV